MTVLAGEYIPPFLATNTEWFFSGFFVPGMVLYSNFSYSCILTFNAIFDYYYSIVCIHQLAHCTLLNKLFHFECL